MPIPVKSPPARNENPFDSLPPLQTSIPHTRRRIRSRHRRLRRRVVKQIRQCDMYLLPLSARVPRFHVQVLKHGKSRPPPDPRGVRGPGPRIRQRLFRLGLETRAAVRIQLGFLVLDEGVDHLGVHHELVDLGGGAVGGHVGVVALEFGDDVVAGSQILQNLLRFHPDRQRVLAEPQLFVHGRFLRDRRGEVRGGGVLLHGGTESRSTTDEGARLRRGDDEGRGRGGGDGGGGEEEGGGLHGGIGSVIGSVIG
mmetsp:Transcript_15713/g.32189  ORF Transcript_15713/g.32189 Transcript_15713/m.32189 type:complete len:253 (-) Transcript_15713:117-875(-)